MCTRRVVLRSGLFAAAAWVAAKSPALAQGASRRRQHGCLLEPGAATRYMNGATSLRLNETGHEKVIPNSGDPDLDFALVQTLSNIADEFGILPGFASYDDFEFPNAFATADVNAVLRNPDGTVLFGKRLLKKLLATPENPDVAIIAVCAHEFGHILQLKRNLRGRVLAGQRTNKRIELQADFFAGYYSGIRKRQQPSFPAAVFALTQFNFGDDDVDAREHHGTSAERGAAIEHGYMASYRDRLPLDEAVEVSVKYVTQL